MSHLYRRLTIVVVCTVTLALLGLILGTAWTAIQREPAGWNWELLLPLFIALCFALFGFYVWAHNPYNPTVILFLAADQLGAANLTFNTLSSLGYREGIHWSAVSLYLLSSVLVHFHLALVRPAQSLSKPRWMLGGLYSLALLAVAGVLWPWGRGSFPDGASRYTLARDGARLAFVAASLIAVVLLLHTYRAASSLAVRRRIRLVLFGTLFGLAPLVGLDILPGTLLGAPFLAYPWTLPFLLLVSLAYAVAIRRHNLLPVDRLISRSVVHLTLSLILALVYLSSAAVLPRLGFVSWVKHPLAWGLVTLLVAVLFAPLRGRLQAVADRLFYDGWYDYQMVVGEMSRAMSGIVDFQELAGLLVGRLSEVLRLRCAALLLETGEEGLLLVEVAGCPRDRFPRHPLPRDGDLARVLSQTAWPLAPEALRLALADASLGEAERAWLGSPEFVLWVPLVREGRLWGLLLLGERPGGDPFEPEDRRLLGALAWNAAIAAENAHLFEALRRRADEVDRLCRQLQRSREEERKRLARELHDRVIQDLVNISFLLGEGAPRLAPTPQGHMEALRSRLRTTTNVLRRLCTELRPAALDDLNLGLAVSGYVQDVAGEWGIPITLHLPEDREQGRVLEGVRGEIALCLFRVLQEALTNVQRHARASRVHVTLAVEAGHVVLEVQDDGRGFRCPARLEALIHQGHFGLVGAQERLEMVSGTLEVISVPGQGTTLRARVPWSEGLESSAASAAERP